MKKLGLIVKEASEKNIKDSLKLSQALLLVRYSGLSGPDMNLLRQSLKGSQSSLFVVKNSVARRALKSADNTGIEALIKNIDGPCGMIFVRDEPVEASKVLCGFIKEHEKLKLEGGFIKDRVLEKQDIEAMAKLPSKQLMRQQLVMALNSPISGLVFTLNQVLAKFVYCLEQIKQKKSTN